MSVGSQSGQGNQAVAGPMPSYYSGNVIGQVPAFTFTGAEMRGPGNGQGVNQYGGTPGGVPQIDTVGAGVQAGPAASQAAYAANKVGKGATHQPLFWSFAIFITGIFILGHVAHVNVRAAVGG